MTGPDQAVIDELTRIVGADHVLTGAMTHGYERDWSGRYVGSTAAVIRPGSTSQVAAALRVCSDHDLPGVPQGGNTGLVGGSVPLHGEVVLTTSRLAMLGPVDRLAGQVTAGAGVTIQRLQDHARSAGLRYGVDFGARGTATVGGSIATNAGGMQVIRFGPTRAQLVGIEAVLADGSVIGDLRGLEKDNTGYHLPSLVCGSEGTLAIVTAARLRLRPIDANTVAALLAVSSIGLAVAAVEPIREIEGIEAIELMLDEGLELVSRELSVERPPLDRAAAYLLLECGGSGGEVDRLHEVVSELDGIVDVAVASDGAARQRLWQHRELHTEAVNRLGPPHKLDVTIPLPAMADFIDDVRHVVRNCEPAAAVWLFGHAGDGNIHVNITGVAPEATGVDEAVLGLVIDSGGSISAEHGIGTAKRKALPTARSSADLAAFRAIKHAFDPSGILNPNVLIPPR
ncbi:MAG: FAD-binding oxidoreductase [Acidimicrobiia bacterium]|nr:FAD-binding oxidoreductase [Acidimicrobiia bacterium]